MAASAEPRDLFAKIWDPIFFTTRNMKDCPVAVVEGELQPTNTASDSSNSVSDTLSYFWGTQDDIPQSSVDEVKEYADLASMKELLDPPSVAACRRGSWLDDLESRNMVNGPTRRIYNDMPMSAATLYRALQAQVTSHSVDSSLAILIKSSAVRSRFAARCESKINVCYHALYH